MNSEFSYKLADLYAAGELTDELEAAMDAEARKDPALRRDLDSLREAVDRIRSEPAPPFTEESFDRILLKIRARGGSIEPRTPEPAHLQFPLPMAG